MSNKIIATCLLFGALCGCMGQTLYNEPPKTLDFPAKETAPSVSEPHEMKKENNYSSLPKETAFVKMDNSTIMVIPPIQGMPDMLGKGLVKAIAKKLGDSLSKEQVNKQSKLYILKGYASAASGSKRTSFITDWQIFDKNGQKIDSFYKQQTLTNSRSIDPWARITSDSLYIIAYQIASTLNEKIATAPQTTSKTDIVKIPDHKIPAPTFDTLRPESSKPDQAAAPSNPETANYIYIHADKKATKPHQSLINAMEKQLKIAGYTIAETANTAGFTIKVALSSESKGDMDHISIIWAVYKGQESLGNFEKLGDITQENNLPAGSLNQNWDEDANFAALGAKNGIVNLIEQAK